jgi:predicted DCC family thiol-disulfide oxidoreductase YuxK
MSNNQVILFDGICNLCNGFVQFVIERDNEGKFKFASLQSDFAADLLAKKNPHFDKENLQSVILIKNDKIITKSDAAIEIGKQLGGLWKASGLLYIFPKFIRNMVYDLVAKYRYKWFGKQDVCWLPSPELKSRFL